MESSLYRYILQHSLRGQLFLLGLTIASLPFVYLSLEVPKRIVNEAIGGTDMPNTLLGFELDQVDYLLVLSSIFLALILLNGGVKYILNVYRGVLGERILRRLRYDLFSRILRFPLPHFKRASQGELIPIITAETEPLGAFIGEAFSSPTLQAGLLITYLGFIFNQDLLLGAFAVAIYPFQMYVIPKLQARVNQLAKQRVLAARDLAARIGDSIGGIVEIRAHDGGRFERADISHRLGTIFNIRVQLYKKKFFIKFLNNFLAQITPFFFYSVGGYYVIKGELSLGALVAVLAAYKDLASPWKELLKYYQTKEDIRVKYAQIIEQFQPIGMFQPAQLATEVPALSGELHARNLVYGEDEFSNSVDGASFAFDLTERIALVGPSAGGKEDLARLVVGLVQPHGGRLELAGKALQEYPNEWLGQRFAYVGSEVHLFSGTVADNLFFPLKHAPKTSAEESDDEAMRSALLESAAAANSTDRIDVDWLDYATVGVDDLEQLRLRGLALLKQVDADEDIYRLGLQSPLRDLTDKRLLEGVLRARIRLRKSLQTEAYQSLVESFDPEHYNDNMSVAENLLFGTPTGQAQGFDWDHLYRHPEVRLALQRHDLWQQLLDIAYQLTEIMLELFADVAPDSDLFEQYSFINAEDFPAFKKLLSDKNSNASIDEHAQDLLMSLPFQLVPARHRLGLIEEPLKQALVQVRKALAQTMGGEAGEIEVFDSARISGSLSVQDNILFGRIAYGQATAKARINQLIATVVDQEGLRELISYAGLSFHVGTSGARLPAALRQKIGVARALLKAPDLLVINDALGVLEPAVEADIIQRLLAQQSVHGVLWALSRATASEYFDKLWVVENGRITEQGRFAELEQAGSALKRYIQ